MKAMNIAEATSQLNRLRVAGTSYTFEAVINGTAVCIVGRGLDVSSLTLDEGDEFFGGRLSPRKVRDWKDAIQQALLSAYDKE